MPVNTMAVYAGQSSFQNPTMQPTSLQDWVNAIIRANYDRNASIEVRLSAVFHRLRQNPTLCKSHEVRQTRRATPYRANSPNGDKCFGHLFVDCCAWHAYHMHRLVTLLL